MNDRERIAKELYEFTGRYGSHLGTSWGIAGDKTRREYLEEADLILEGILFQLGYRRKPELELLTGDEIEKAYEKGFDAKVKAFNLTDEIELKRWEGRKLIARAQFDKDRKAIEGE